MNEKNFLLINKEISQLQSKINKLKMLDKMYQDELVKINSSDEEVLDSKSKLSILKEDVLKVNYEIESLIDIIQNSF